MSATALMVAVETDEASVEGLTELVAEPAAAPRSRTARELAREAVSLLSSVEGLLEAERLTTKASLPELADALTDLAGHLSAQLFSAGTRPLRAQETMQLLARAQELRVEISAYRTRRSLCRQRAVTAALRELRAANTLDQIFKLAPAGLCECGFSRAWISAVQRESWRLVASHPAAAGTRRASTEEPALSPLLQDSPEAEVLRRRRPMLVADASKQRALDPLIEETFASRSYVVAPLLLETRVVAFLHADRPEDATALDEDDRDVLALFGEMVSQAVQRVMLAERLERIRIDVAAATRSVEQLVEDRCCETMTLAGTSQSTEGAGEITGAPSAVASQPRAGYMTSQGASRLSSLLTAREMEVLGLMAGGETNASIARELVISEGTVKSHVKSILRKLRVANRAQAVSRYFRLVRSDDAG